MARNIKKIAHDLLPLSDAVTELSLIISQLLEALRLHATFDSPQTNKYFSECANASQKLAISAKLIRSYVKEVNNEADKEGILKG